MCQFKLYFSAYYLNHLFQDRPFRKGTFMGVIRMSHGIQFASDRPVHVSLARSHTHNQSPKKPKLSFSLMFGQAQCLPHLLFEHTIRLPLPKSSSQDQQDYFMQKITMIWPSPRNTVFPPKCSSIQAP